MCPVKAWLVSIGPILARWGVVIWGKGDNFSEIFFGEKLLEIKQRIM